MTIPLSVIWKDEQLTILDQRLLPQAVQYETLETLEQVHEAIFQLKVRGAPAIGIAAAYGLALAARRHETADIELFRDHVKEDAAYLISSRPTAVNLAWAIDRLVKRIEQAGTVAQAKAQLIEEAQLIRDEDEAACRNIGEHALELLVDKEKILTICNAGSIATAKYGTALAPFHLGIERGREFEVYACETRPLFQGARLTVWELQQAGVDVTLITDSMAAHTIAAKGIEAIIVGADRITANGDTANKIGTLNLAILAHVYGIPFYVAAPVSTFDLSLDTGNAIPIEERAAEEVIATGTQQNAPDGTKVFNPAFDVTPATYITAIITERGVIRPNDKQTIETQLYAVPSKGEMI
ncbi:S-methyl-5-thioribose-1-phosphate isomerase [Planococcus sp. 11815]|uniref:S-methyl-5-thioribose-1-phosphate isomerase n=1 Tax=Planococcus sp. 11815 TaxID=2939413 RepID=UPI003A0EA72A